MVAGHYLGTGLVASAFRVAFTIPNLFRKLFGEGALSAAFIPLYAQAIVEKGETGDGPGDAANDFAAASVNLLCVTLLVVTLIGEGVIWAWMTLSRDLRPDRLLTLRLTAIMLPYVLLICGTALLSGVLQVHRRFGPPAFAPVILNVCHIVVLMVGAWMLGLSGAHSAEGAIDPRQSTLAVWLGFFVLVAGALQVLTLLPALRACGFRLRPIFHFRSPRVQRMLKLTVPVALGAGVLQLSVLLDKAISMGLMRGVDRFGKPVDTFVLFGRLIHYPMQAGAPARLDLAQFLYQFPLGIFAIALATAIFPGLSGEALAKDRDAFKSVLRGGIEASLWEGIPASLGLILVRYPAIRLLFQHGQISGADADLIAQSVLFYAGGIWAFSLLQIVNRAYYAVHDTVTPLVMSVVNIVLNLVVEIPLLWWPRRGGGGPGLNGGSGLFGEPAMAVGTLVSFAVQAIVMLWMLDRKIGGIGLRRSAAPVLKMLAATALMGAACIFTQHLPGYPTAERRGSWAMQLALQMGVGATVYLLASEAMGLDILRQILPKRLRRNRK